jgi:transcriptional regulator with XRE-family HTH domain
MVAAQVDAHLPTNDRIGAAVEVAAERSGGSLTALAQRLGVALSTVSLWKDGRRQPSLDGLLRLARDAGFELLDVVAGDVRRLRLTPLPTEVGWLPDRVARYRDIDWRPVRRALRRAAMGSGRESPSVICARHGVDPAQARRRHPELFHAASTRFARRRHLLALFVAVRNREAVLAAMREIHAEGLYPSKRRTQRRCGRRMGYKEFYAVWRQGLDELGYRRA